MILTTGDVNKKLVKNKLSLSISAALLPLLLTTSQVSFAAEQEDVKKTVAAETKATEQKAEAQDEEVEVNEVESTEVIVVTGFRNSASQQRFFKKNSNNVSDSIFAEDMGKMPDENIAEAMQRITGVGIDRVDGEGSTVTIRGVDPSLNQISLNGQVLTNGGDDNAVDLSTMSADMLKSIEVIKSPSADHDEGSLGGTVNLKTFRPMQSNGRKINGSVQAKYSDLADETDYAAKLSYTDKLSDKFGVSTSLFYDERNTRQDYYGMNNYKVFPNVVATSYQTGENLGKIDTYEPTLLDMGIKFNDRVRYGGAATFEYLPDDISSVWFDLSYSLLNNDFDSHQARVTSLRKGNIVDEASGTSVYASTPTGGGNILSRQQETETETITAGLGYERQMGDWLLTTKFGYSWTQDTSLKNRRVNFKPASTPMSYSWLDNNGNFTDIPTVSFDNDLGFFDTTQAALFQIYDDNRGVKDYITSFGFDLERDLMFGPIVGVKVGAKYFERNKDNSATSGNTPFDTDSNGNQVFLADVALDFPVDDYFSGAANNAIEGWTIPDFNYIYNTYLPNGFDGPKDLINTYRIETKASAAYVKFDFDAFDSKFLGDFGVRFVKTDLSSVGHQGINFPAVTDDGSVIYPVDLENDYTNVLPSFNGRYVLSDDMLIRFSAAKVMARPTFSEVRPGTVITATNPTNVHGAGGNPLLDPTEATQYDVSWEWYFDESGLLAIAGFYKDIDSFIFAKTELQSITECPDGVSAENCALLYDVPVKQSVNGEGGHIGGAEVSYQQDFSFLPGFLKDFGTILNYTYTDSDATFVSDEEDNSEYYADFPFLNTSKDTYNATVYWEKDGHSLRLAYNYRSDRLIKAVQLNSSVWADSSESLDFSGVIKLNKQFNLTFSATNLTDETDRNYYTRTIAEDGLEGEGNALTSGAPTWRTGGFSQTGREYRVGITAKF